jgi:hypothetical protein
MKIGGVEFRSLKKRDEVKEVAESDNVFLYGRIKNKFVYTRW